MYGSVILFVLSSVSSVGFWSVCCVGVAVEEFDLRTHVGHNCCSWLVSASGDIDMSAMMPLSEKGIFLFQQNLRPFSIILT